jgi:thiamine pyrophosphokinase
MVIKRAVIFANGELPDPAAIRPLLRPEDWIVAADGGTRHALACGCVPRVVIGDLDSLPEALRDELEDQGTEFRSHPAAKDETDLELALLYVVANGVKTILVMGALGGRLDQLIANIQLLARPELAGLDVQVVDGNQTARLIRDQATIHGAAGDRVSLIPLGGDAHGVRTSGLAWRLADETLTFGEARGVSNVMTGPEACVRVAAGLLLCVHERIGEPANLQINESTDQRIGGRTGGI